MISKFNYITAKAQNKLCRSLIYTLSKLENIVTSPVTWLFRLKDDSTKIMTAYEIQQIKTVDFKWSTSASGATGTTSRPAGQRVGYTVGNGFTPPRDSITFNSADRKPVLIITGDGDVEWHGKPSEAAKALERSFQFTVEDMKGVTKAARRRYYLKACQNILNKAESMEHAEFIDFLKKQVYNRERKVIIDSLQGTN